MNTKLQAKINTIQNPAIRDKLNRIAKYVTDGALESIVNYIIKLEEKTNVEQ